MSSVSSFPNFFRARDPKHSNPFGCVKKNRWEMIGGSKVIRFVKNTIWKPILPYIYYASSASYKKKLDPKRLKESREVLEQIGGKHVVLETWDHEKLDGFYFDVRKFKQIICSLGGRFGFETVGGKRIPVIYIYTRKLQQLFAKMKIDIDKGIVYSKVHFSNATNAETVEQQTPPVTILTQGNAGIYERNRQEILRILLCGQNCMVFNLRGTGASTGTPGEEESYRDIETVYQYLRDGLHFPPSLIHVLGYCLGSGMATELAHNHPGVHLTLDRSFCQVTDIAAQVMSTIMVGVLQECVKIVLRRETSFPRLESLLNKAFSMILRPIFPVRYNNLSKVSKISGSVCIVNATKDDVVPKGSDGRFQENILCAKNRNEGPSSYCHITMEGGHCDPWDEKTSKAYGCFLGTKKLLRSFGETPRPLGAPSPTKGIWKLEDCSARNLEGSAKESRSFF